MPCVLAPGALIANQYAWQGTLLRRHCIPLTATSASGAGNAHIPGDKCVGVRDLGVGRTITLYCRAYCIVDADTFTRAYMEAQGMPQLPALAWPVSPIDQYRAEKNKPSGQCTRRRGGWEGRGVPACRGV